MFFAFGHRTLGGPSLVGVDKAHIITDSNLARPRDRVIAHRRIILHSRKSVNQNQNDSRSTSGTCAPPQRARSCLFASYPLRALP